jgi:outer membrane immunogenic protein
VPLRAQRCGCATYAVGNASASSEQTTRSGKEHAKQEGQDSAGDGTEPMKKFLLATVSMVALTSVSRATDMPAAMPAKSPMYMPAPVSDWTGLYIGVQGGVARRDASFEVSGNALSRDGSNTGAAVGGSAGYNLQQGNFVYGLEGDWNWIGAKASAAPHVATIFRTSTTYDINWLATLDGRVGLAVDSTLIYLTGGAALGHVKNSILANNGPIATSFTQDQTKVGWTVGAGVEHMFAPHWSARAVPLHRSRKEHSQLCIRRTIHLRGPRRI